MTVNDEFMRAPRCAEQIIHLFIHSICGQPTAVSRFSGMRITRMDYFGADILGKSPDSARPALTGALTA